MPEKQRKYVLLERGIDFEWTPQAADATAPPDYIVAVLIPAEDR